MNTNTATAELSPEQNNRDMKPRCYTVGQQVVGDNQHKGEREDHDHGQGRNTTPKETTRTWHKQNNKQKVTADIYMYSGRRCTVTV